MSNAEPEFVTWPKIKRLQGERSSLEITQKMDGTNAQLLIEPDGALGVTIHVGSRSRWLSETQENHGFYKWVQEYKEELASSLGFGRFYGEFCGPGIQTGEGLKERQLFIFNAQRTDKTPPKFSFDCVQWVPLLYSGPFNWEAVENALSLLQNKGSIVNGFGNPEGIIIKINGSHIFKLYVRDYRGQKKLNYYPMRKRIF